MRITIVGTGYVGLVTGTCLAELGHEVTCVDLDDGRIEGLRRGVCPIHEPGLEAMIARNARAGRLDFSTGMSSVAVSEAVFIAVGTPPMPDGSADLRQVLAAADAVGRAMRGPLVVATKSTVPVGTGDRIEQAIRSARPGLAFSVVSNPEFLREGSAVGDFMRPDRVVVGSDGDLRARAVMDAVYAPLGEVPVLHVGRRTAEMVKYASNAFLAVKVAFVNEIADLCEATGADVTEVARGMGLDRRIGAGFLEAGPGYGGSCFPKDTRALAGAGRDNGSPVRIVEAAILSNDRRRRAMAGKVVRAMGGDVRGRTVAVLGLTFKAGTDDMREAPSVGIVSALREAGAVVRVHDPAGMDAARGLLGDVAFADDASAAVSGADCVVLATVWEDYLGLDLGSLAASMRRPVMVDLRNAFDPAAAARAGFSYTGVGRGGTAVTPAFRRAA